MTLTPHEIQTRLARILPKVRKPARYTGGEYNQVIKDWEAIPLKVALVFPDIYEIGMSNLGLAILYETINRRADALAERAYAPWVDMEAAMRQAGIPLYSLETKHPLSAFDIVGISLPMETLYTNLLNVLDLGGIPLHSAERTAGHPLVIAGGHATFNPEPIAPFVDAFVIGEGEEVIHEILDVYRDWKASGAGRQDLLQRLSRLWGVYVPAFYRAHYDEDGVFARVEPIVANAPLPIVKRIVAQLPPPPTRLVVPYIDTVHDRFPIEITRGCTRGCRYCQAGMVMRPVRERSVAEIVQAIEEGLRHTGFEEVGLLSLSSSDYTHILELVQEVTRRFGEAGISISLPSLRIETFSIELMEALEVTRRSGFTLAPEAGSERMRNIINKPIATAQLLEVAREIYRRGWHTIKLYFMIGLPGETMDDVQAIADLSKAVLAEGRRVMGRRAQVHASVGTFIPKPHTPFQWAPTDTAETIRAKQTLLRRALKRERNIRLSLVRPEETLLEAWLSRGDRRLAEVIYRAWQKGAKFDAWDEHLNPDLWREAFAEAGLDPASYAHRRRPIDEPFPWDHISVAVRKTFLAQDYLQSQQGETRIDCRHRCYACGILPTFADLRFVTPGEVWKCPEVKRPPKRKAPYLPTPTLNEAAHAPATDL